jgi:hypothetical protein
VEKADAAADVDAAKRLGIALEDEQRARFGTSAHARLYRVEAAADLARETFAVRGPAHGLAKILQRREDAVQACMPVAEHPNLCSRQLCLHVGL